MGFYFLSVVPVPFVKSYMATIATKQIVSLIPQTAFFLGLEVFTRAEVFFLANVLRLIGCWIWYKF